MAERQALSNFFNSIAAGSLIEVRSSSGGISEVIEARVLNTPIYVRFPTVFCLVIPWKSLVYLPCQVLLT